MQYPYCRMRRRRINHSVREILAENRLFPADLILPIFVVENDYYGDENISSMSGIIRHKIAGAVNIAREAYSLGIRAMMLFPVISDTRKDEFGTEAIRDDNLICRVIASIKESVPDMMVIADIALDPYTSHGHDGLLNSDGYVDNDSTIDVLKQQAVNLVNAGCYAIAPSDMMDGRVIAIREILESLDFHNVLILSYAAKYSSCLYAPFRDALCLKNKNCDKRTYQMDLSNGQEAVNEVMQDIDEGADIVIVKPAMMFLDIIYRVSAVSTVPVFGYQVSGEYAIIKSGIINYENILMESLLSIKRAGARGIITYAAIDAAKILNKLFK